MTRQRKWQIEREKFGLCVKCGKSAQIHSHGKRAGAYSVYCLDHLLQQRERNRVRAELNRWNQVGGDPAAWAAVVAWRTEKLNGYYSQNCSVKLIYPPQSFKSINDRKGLRPELIFASSLKYNLK
jgi:hypothetical protein